MPFHSVQVRRLFNQRLEGEKPSTPQEVVAWLGAVQAQDYAGAKWALGLRLDGTIDADIDTAFSYGAILRTHVLRPTWHFVTPKDIGWMLQLTAPRVHIANATIYRQVGLDDNLAKRSQEIIANTLQGGKQLTRTELGQALLQAGIRADGIRLGYIMMWAELDGLICSGGRRGKQFTYALLEERATQAKNLSHAESICELVRRYFTSHGPARIQDFTGWSGLTQAVARVGMQMLGSCLLKETLDGQDYWYTRDAPEPAPISQVALLLPPYDEYMLGYKDHRITIDPAYTSSMRNEAYGGAMVLGGQVLGSWRRTLRPGMAEVTLSPWRQLSQEETSAFHSAAQRYGDFLNMPVVVF